MAKKAATLKRVKTLLSKTKPRSPARKRIYQKRTYIGKDGLRYWKYGGGRVSH
jgi:hypothetical protein